MIEPNDFLDFAEGLYSNLSQEDDCIEVRNSISRAYYYVYHYGMKRFVEDKRGKRLKTKSANSHEMLHNFFFEINSENIAHKLLSLRRKRNDADYDLDLNLTKKEAGIILRDAKNLRDRMNRITPQT